MAKVYVAQVPWRKDGANRRPAMDMSPAFEYGKVVEVFPPSASVFNTEPLMDQIKSTIEDYDFDAGDSLILTGDPAITTVIVGLLAKRGDNLRILKFDRHSHSYNPVEVKL